MFDLEKEGSVRRLSRRGFLFAGAGALAGGFLWTLRPGLFQMHAYVSPDAKDAAAKTGGDVTIVQFSDSGQRLKTVKIAKVVKTEDEWRKQLSPNAFDI